MTGVFAYASRSHYAEHIAPIVDQLRARGRPVPFYAPRAGQDWGTLLPRLDARQDEPQVAIVASWADYQTLQWSPVVFVEHGAGQSYDGDPVSRGDSSFSGGRGRERVELFVVPNRRVADRCADVGARVVAAGCPKLDRAHAAGLGWRKPGAVPTVAFTFHWDCPLVPETRSAWPHYRAEIERLAIDDFAMPRRMLGHWHPRWETDGHDQLRAWWTALGVETARDLADVLDRADVLVADNTSALFEFASLDKPVVVLDAPWYRRDVEHGARFWEWADVGVRISDPAQLESAIEEALVDPSPVRQVRRRIVGETYAARDGRAAGRAADAIEDLLDDPDWSPRMLDPTDAKGNPVFLGRSRPRVRRDPIPEPPEREFVVGPDGIVFLDDVPQSNVQATLDWVNGSKGRALAVLEVENRRPETHRRSSIIRPLERVLERGE